MFIELGLEQPRQYPLQRASCQQGINSLLMGQQYWRRQAGRHLNNATP